MTVYLYTGGAFRSVSGVTVAVVPLELRLLTDDAVTTMPYSVLPPSDPNEDLSEVALNINEQGVAINGRSVDLHDPDFNASIGVIGWGASNSTTILSIDFVENNDRTEYVLALGGTPLPSLTSPAELAAFDNSITSVGPAPTTGPLAPGQSLDLASFPMAVVETNNLVLGTDGDDTVIGTAGDDVILPLEAAFQDSVMGSMGDDTIVFSDVQQGKFYDVDYSGLDAGITLNLGVDPAANGGLGQYQAEVLKGANGTDIFIDADRTLSWVTGDGMWVSGTAFADTFNTSTPDETWLGLSGGAGIDTFNLTDGETVRISYDASDVTSGANVNLVTGVVSNDGYGTTDMINVTPGTDIRVEIPGTDLNDSILGSARNERFILEQGNNTLDGGAGFDRLRYDRTGVDAVTVNLATSLATGTWDGNAFIHSFQASKTCSGRAMLVIC